MPKATTTSLFRNRAPEFVAVVLASSTGSRLSPVTSSNLPKHMMPICGIPVISRLLSAIEASGFQECVVMVAQNDKITIPHLKNELLRGNNPTNKEDGGGNNDGGDENDANISNQSKDRNNQKGNDPLSGNYKITSSKPNLLVLESLLHNNAMKITMLSLHEDCQGSIDALRKMEEVGVVLSTSNMVVLPGDFVVFETSVLRNLCDTHRQGYQGLPKTTNHSTISNACTVLLTDVGEQDEHGAPLKESAKAKKGGLARDEVDIEYIALSYTSSASSSSAPRLVWKQLKLDVQEKTANLAETPKLSLPKPRLRIGAVTRVRTDWNDVHVYVLSPWVRRLVVERRSLMTIQGDLLPLLISRQFQGVAATFGSKVEPEVVQDILLSSLDLMKVDLAGPLADDEPPLRGSALSSRPSSRSSEAAGRGRRSCTDEYAVLAYVQDEAVRTHTIASYLHANRELLTHASSLSPGSGAITSTTQAGEDASGSTNNNQTKNPCLRFPPNSSVRSKFHSILLPGAACGDKVTFKSTSVGRNCKLGAKCRLNNVVIMDDVTIGDNVILQNSIIGSGCSIGDNCNLNDCQVGPGEEIGSGVKEKGESFP